MFKFGNYLFMGFIGTLLIGGCLTLTGCSAMNEVATEYEFYENGPENFDTSDIPETSVDDDYNMLIGQ